jgi:transposase-like protein
MRPARGVSPKGGDTLGVGLVRCPHCQSGEVVQYGTAANGKERFRCQQTDRGGRTVMQEYAYQGRVPEGKRQIVEITRNGSGVRDSARVRPVSPTTVMAELNKKPRLSNRSTKLSLKGAVPAPSP